jgi:hypothetical protein
MGGIFMLNGRAKESSLAVLFVRMGPSSTGLMGLVLGRTFSIFDRLSSQVKTDSMNFFSILTYSELFDP